MSKVTKEKQNFVLVHLITCSSLCAGSLAIPKRPYYGGIVFGIALVYSIVIMEIVWPFISSLWICLFFYCYTWHSKKLFICFFVRQQKGKNLVKFEACCFFFCKRISKWMQFSLSFKTAQCTLLLKYSLLKK